MSIHHPTCWRGLGNAVSEVGCSSGSINFVFQRKKDIIIKRAGKNDRTVRIGAGGFSSQ
jgi:hypothetical protein